MKEESASQAQAKEAGPGGLVIRRIYVKDLSFEVPNGLAAFKKAWKPKVSQDLNTEINEVDKENHLFEVVLKLTVTVKHEDDEVAFLAEVHQAGLFFAQGMERPQLTLLLTSHCPQILYPYVREAIDNIAIRGGFPPLLLPPINFDALLAKAMAEAKARGASGEDDSSSSLN